MKQHATENTVTHDVYSILSAISHQEDALLSVLNKLAELRGVKPTMRERTKMLQRDMILDALDKSKGRIGTAAKELDITERMLRYKIQKLEIKYESRFKKRRIRTPKKM